ncbi:MAG: glycosyltransferase [Verrucomicrobiota bacterium]
MQHEIIRRAGLTDITTYEPASLPPSSGSSNRRCCTHFATEATAKARGLSAQCGVPFTFTAHGYDIHRKPPEDFHERAMAARAVVTVSEANADYIATTFGVPVEHLSVIPCGVNTQEFHPVNGASPANGEPPWIVCVARHVKVKNLVLLLEACAELRRRGVEFRCALIGDGPLHEELKAKRALLGLGNIVSMPGALEQREVLSWWQRAAIGVLSSENEGMPVSLMEAAACGVPVVAPAVGGIPELVRHGETGLLTKPNDVVSLTVALERLLRDPKLRAVFGRAARQQAEAKFSVKRQVDQLLGLWSEVEPPEGRNGASVGAAMGNGLSTIAVKDPFNATADAALPEVVAALNPELAAAALKRHLPRLSGDGRLKLKAIRVVRHKPGKRCVVEYDVKVKRPDHSDTVVTLIGKLRSRRSGNEGFRLQEMIWNAGFHIRNNDEISVPEPLGVVSDLKMWFQRKVAGETATKLLGGPEGTQIARRIAEAIHKLHRADLVTDRTHTVLDELRILRDCFDKVSAQKRAWTGRLAKLMVSCEKLGESLPATKVCGIHRDFYSSQVIVDGSRLWLIDFDCFCMGDPGLDAGNFIGHITEQALRERGDANALQEVEHALEDRFVELSGESTRPAVRAYTALTLGRHIYLSTQFPERSHTTEALLELCEQRLLA